ncbi:MAG: arylsulfatase [Planctomycetes bacterium]|nr:arylsulfatase [Planctomycetota bacterium]
MHTRRGFLRLTGLAASSLVAGCHSDRRGEAWSAAERTNVIFILADDLGYGDLGCYGQQAIQTPNLDRMAREGMIFTNHYAGSTVCAPSRCCLMTGLHSGHAFIRGNDRIPLRPSDVTVAELMKQAGYATGIIGKWGLGEPDTTGVPNRKGFDYWFGYLNQQHAHNYYPDYLWRNEEKVPLANKVEPVGAAGGVATTRVQYSHDLFAAEALKFLDRHRKQPFFLYLAFTIPHANNESKPDGMEVPSYGAYADRDWPNPQKGYAAMITRMDRDIGRLLDRLKALGLDGKTLVLFSSDNGPHREGGADPAFFRSSGGLRGDKRDLYEGGIRVPLIARWPGRIPAGSGSDHVCAFWDFLPTCCELAGVATPRKMDGLSYLPTLLGRSDEQQSHPYLYWEFHEQGKKQAVRMGNWKGVRLNVAKAPNGPIELYDLAADPAERENIADRNPEVVSRIASIMTSARTVSERWQ